MIDKLCPNLVKEEDESVCSEWGPTSERSCGQCAGQASIAQESLGLGTHFILMSTHCVLLGPPNILKLSS